MSGRGRPVIAVPRRRSTTTTSSAAQYHYNLRGRLLHATFPTRSWTYSETTPAAVLAGKMAQCSISASTDISRCGCTAVEKLCGSTGTACVVLPAGL